MAWFRTARWLHGWSSAGLILLVAFPAWANPPENIGIVQEGSTAYVDMAFVDQSNAATSPTSVTYRVTNTKSGATMLGPVTVLNPGTTLSFEIPWTVNRRSSTSTGETVEHRTIDATMLGAADRWTKTWIYSVELHKFVPVVPPTATPTLTPTVTPTPP